MKHCVVPLAHVRKASITEHLQGYFHDSKTRNSFETAKQSSESVTVPHAAACLPVRFAGNNHLLSALEGAADSKSLTGL